MTDQGPTPAPGEPVPAAATDPPAPAVWAPGTVPEPPSTAPGWAPVENLPWESPAEGFGPTSADTALPAFPGGTPLPAPPPGPAAAPPLPPAPAAPPASASAPAAPPLQAAPPLHAPPLHAPSPGYAAGQPSAWVPPPAGAPFPGPVPGPYPGVRPAHEVGFPVGTPAPAFPAVAPAKSGSKLPLILGLVGTAVLGLLLVVGLVAGGGGGGSTREDDDAGEEVTFALPSSLGGLDLVEDDQVSEQVDTIVGSLPADQRAEIERSLEVGLYSDSTDNALAFIYGGTTTERAELLNGFNDKLSDEVGSTLEVGAVDVEEFSVNGHDVLCLEGNQLTWCKAEDGGLLVLVAARALSEEAIADLAAEAVETALDA